VLLISSSQQRGGAGLGTLAVVAAAALQGVQFVVSRSALRRMHPIDFTIFIIWAGTIVDLPLARGLAGAFARAPLPATLSILYLGLLSSTVAMMTWSYALQHLTAPRAAAFLYLVPPVTLVVSWIWLGEVPQVTTLIGGAITVGGVVVVQRFGRATMAPVPIALAARRGS
jgi:drug/metabolite transporter (DMT)-like permease